MRLEAPQYNSVDLESRATTAASSKGAWGRASSKTPRASRQTTRAARSTTADAFALNEVTAREFLLLKFGAIESKLARRRDGGRKTRPAPSTAKLVSRLPPVAQSSKEAVRLLLDVYSDHMAGRGAAASSPVRDASAERPAAASGIADDAHTPSTSLPPIWTAPFTQSVDALSIK